MAALGLLSTLFLLSRAIDPGQAIPFAEKEVQDRLRDQQITGPFFTGATSEGDELSFYADVLTRPDGQTGMNHAENLRATINTPEGSTFRLQSDLADFDIAEDVADLLGKVILTTSTGYRLQSEKITSDLSGLNIQSPGAVHGTTPGGTLEAGAMSITQTDEQTAPQLVFTNRVKLIYKPKSKSE
ncbi:LPS export ABC transporter periplasmic protein LptC [Sulfitobacter pontiacus]|uniref:LPS export ABC transporter periplasmic protein LptC n=1 Tax=Sulfitobacter pontiacus TaxID=60137 RepID=UPI001F0CE898|nr:LPS export ABC transporter periplasmic protein LptC [Sulfitobacter pontiacus]